MHPLRLGDGAARDLPPAPSLARFVADWSPEWALLVGLGLAAGLYLWGVLRLRRRGDRWGVGRTLAWLIGVGVVAVATMSGLAAYDDVLFSAHAAQHMLLAMVAPIPLALGAPVTLALRTLPARPRRWLLAAMHSRVARVLASAPVGFGVIVGSLYGLYFTGLYEATLRSDVLHQWVHVHLLLSGCLFFWPILGIDPIPGRLPYWGRLLLLFVTLPVHAVLGLVLLMSTTVVAQDYYADLHRPYAVSLLSDQSTGGGIMWGTGDLLAILVFGALVAQWVRTEERAAAREARRPERHSELRAREDAYNDRLAALAAADAAARTR